MAVRTAPESIPTPRLEDILARAGAKDRASIEKHLAACDAEPDPNHGNLWRRLAAKLGALVPLPVQAAAPQAVLFFIPDGKYRQQVFALEDRRDGMMALYLPDILAQAVDKRIVLKADGEYVVGNSRKNVLHVSTIDASNTPDAPPHVKQMLGWNRKAVRITLSVSESDSPQVKTAESLCNLAAKRWAAAVA